MARGSRKEKRRKHKNVARHWRTKAARGKALKGPAKPAGVRQEIRDRQGRLISARRRSQDIESYQAALAAVVKQRYAQPRTNQRGTASSVHPPVMRPKSGQTNPSSSWRPTARSLTAAQARRATSEPRASFFR